MQSPGRAAQAPGRARRTPWWHCDEATARGQRADKVAPGRRAGRAVWTAAESSLAAQRGEVSDRLQRGSDTVRFTFSSVPPLAVKGGLQRGKPIKSSLHLSGDRTDPAPAESRPGEPRPGPELARTAFDGARPSGHPVRIRPSPALPFQPVTLCPYPPSSPPCETGLPHSRGPLLGRWPPARETRREQRKDEGRKD